MKHFILPGCMLPGGKGGGPGGRPPPPCGAPALDMANEGGIVGGIVPGGGTGGNPGGGMPAENTHQSVSVTLLILVITVHQLNILRLISLNDYNIPTCLMSNFNT